MQKNVWNLSHDLGWQIWHEHGINFEAIKRDPDLIQYLHSILTKTQIRNLFASWYFLARPEQLPPTHDFEVWTYMAGRGSGKTRTGAEWVRGKIMSGCKKGMLVGTSAAQVRDVMITDGILQVCKPWDRDINGKKMGVPLYESSKRRLTWANGATVLAFSAEAPEDIRGQSREFMWTDELGAWAKADDAWDNAVMSLREGERPQTFVSTTPRHGHKLIIELADKSDPQNQLFNPDYVMTVGGSMLNAENLAPGVIERLLDKYGGTQIGRQELDGILLREVEGALWTLDQLDKCRVDVNRLRQDNFWFERIVVAVDPATTSTEHSDEHGIVVAGLGNDKHAYVLEDATVSGRPEVWGQQTAKMFEKWDADLIVAEKNQGGEMVEHVIHGANPDLHVKLVHASRGKKARAEPVSQKYEQGKVHHVGNFPSLESQMTTWEFLESKGSPDRIDALVWAMHELIVDTKTPKGKAKPISGLI